MKIFSAKQIKEWDAYTIRHEPITSLDLMERAATQCVGWIERKMPGQQLFAVFCGPGNNGGDGLAIARLLTERHKKTAVYILQQSSFSTDFTTNLHRLRISGVSVQYISSAEDFPAMAADTMLVDALFGYGLNRPLQGLPARLVEWLNQTGCPIISIDMPSGLFADQASLNPTAIKATYTLSFQQLKFSFLFPENQFFLGEVTVLDIGLHPAFYVQQESPYELISKDLLRSFFKPRPRFAHKGNFGNLVLVAGSQGMMGAAVLAARACLRSGAGKLTCYVPANGYTIMQASVPEAMCITDESATHHTFIPYNGHYDGYALGPGWGSYPDNLKVLAATFDLAPRQLIVDADGLNTLAANPILFKKIPSNTILTPHLKEFERLFGKTANHAERVALASAKAKEYGIIILLKGNYSCIVTPGGKTYFNPTGNPGMATGGSGDVLTGILLGLSGQYEDAVRVALLGVYLHGLAGDIAAGECTEEAMIASDIIQHLPHAFKALKTV